MKFSVPTNWEEDLIPKLKKGDIDELYGSLARDIIGGGRASFLLPQISKRKAASHINQAHRSGLKFNYILNATCLGNREWTINWQRHLAVLLDWLTDIGVDRVTISIPYLLELIKKRYPKLKVCVSTQAGVDSVSRAKYWEELGADKITLSFVDVNRNIGLIRRIKQSVKCELQLIANLLCLKDCPFHRYHSVLHAHASQSDYYPGSFFIDYCSLKCTYMRLVNPVEFIRSPWIRPEDIHYYENIGLDSIKLVDRGMTSEAISFITEAYLKREYDGNLLDLMPHPSKNILFKKSSFLRKLRFFFHPFLVNIFRLEKGRRLFTGASIYIDNKKLDGFLKYFIDKDCSLQSCQECKYCEKVAKETLSIDPGSQPEKIKEFLSELVSGEMFKYS